MPLADVSGSEPSGPSSELSRSSVGLGDLSGDFSVLVSCPSRLQGLFLLLFLLLRAGCSTECSRSIASALHSVSFISLESRWSVFLLLNSDTISGLTTVLSCMLRGPTFWNLAPWMSSFARWYWFSSLVSWLSAFLCWLVITLPNLRASSEVLSSMTFCLFGKHSSAKLFQVTCGKFQLVSLVLGLDSRDHILLLTGCCSGNCPASHGVLLEL